MAPDTSNNTFLLEIDGTTCYTVGGGSIPAGAWTWVDYQNGTTGSKIQQSLTQGVHNLKLIGNKPGVKLDRIIALSDPNCVPTGLGDDCNKPSDTTPPVVSLTTPPDNAQVSGTVALTATASDNIGVSKVEFYDNSSLIGTAATSPYTVNWDTTTTTNGGHLLTARAFDTTDNISVDNNTVNVQNGDQQAPSTPEGLTATAAAYNKVTLAWTASTDNVGVVGYTIQRNGVLLTTITGATNYQDTSVLPNTTYNYRINAYDAAGNKSAFSTAVSTQTPDTPDTQAPSTPEGLTATAISSSQINLNWQASTDNIGVSAYNIYRNNTKIASVTTTSFGDTGLQTSTSYSYTVRARDSAGNESAPSSQVSATTNPQQVSTSVLRGRIANNLGSPISSARIVVPTGNRTKVVTRSLTDGSYSLTLKSGGRYSVTYSKRGYTPQTFTLVLASGGILTQNVTLVKK